MANTIMSVMLAIGGKSFMSQHRTRSHFASWVSTTSGRIIGIVGNHSHGVNGDRDDRRFDLRQAEVDHEAPGSIHAARPRPWLAGVMIAKDIVLVGDRDCR